MINYKIADSGSILARVTNDLAPIQERVLHRTLLKGFYLETLKVPFKHWTEEYL